MSLLVDDDELNDAAIDQNGIADADVIDQALVIYIYRISFLCRSAAHP